MASKYFINILVVLALLHLFVNSIKLTDDDDYDFYKDNSS